MQNSTEVQSSPSKTPETSNDQATPASSNHVSEKKFNGKNRAILLFCVPEARRFSEIARAVNISESGLAKNLTSMEHSGLVAKTESGYLATSQGQEVANKLRREDETRRQLLARKLLVLQNLVSTRELLKFENVRALLGEAKQSTHSYEALAVSSAIEVSYLTDDNQELDPPAEVAIYEQALDLLRHLPRESVRSVNVTVRFNLEDGYRNMMRILRDDIDEASPQAKARLETLMARLHEKKEAALLDAIKRFL